MKTNILKWFKENYNDLYEALKITKHSHSNGNVNPFHEEDDVFSHSMLVLDLVENNINQIFAALLHDIGKIYTRYEKKSGKVSFRNHENVSMVKSIDILNNASHVFDIDKLLVLKLIAWHGTLWNKIPIEERLKTINRCYGHQYDFFNQLIKFVEADAYGRNMSESISETELKFIDSQFAFLHNYIPFNTQAYKTKRPLNLIVLIGLSGSGKSTYVKKLDGEFSIVSVDNYFYKRKMKYDFINYNRNIKKAYSLTIQEMMQYVLEEKNVVIDMTNLSKKSRRRKTSKFPISKYNHKAIVFLTGEQQISLNLRNRKYKQLNNDILFKQMKQFELPNFDEFDEIKYIL